jgi:hypothetical protein
MADLSADIRKDIEANPDWEIITEIVNRLQGDGVTVTPDVLAAIKMTLELSDGAVE